MTLNVYYIFYKSYACYRESEINTCRQRNNNAFYIYADKELTMFLYICRQRINKTFYKLMSFPNNNVVLLFYKYYGNCSAFVDNYLL